MMARQQIKTFQKFAKVPGLNAELDRINKQILDQIGILDPAFAELYKSGTSIAVTIAVVDTYYLIDGLSPGQKNYAVLNRNSVRIKVAGIYKIICSMAFTHDVSSTISHSAIFVNGVEAVNIKMENKIVTAGDFINMTLTGYLLLKAQDLLQIKIKADKTGTITINHINLNIMLAK